MKATALVKPSWIVLSLLGAASITQAAQESLFGSSDFPPATAIYTEWAAGPRHFDDVHVVVQNARFSRWTPQLGQTGAISAPETNSVTCDVEMDVSTDGGQTFQTCSAQARGIITVKPGTGSSGVPSYATELLQLDISGGTLPGGLRLRESPTLQSTGQTTVRTVVFGGGTSTGASDGPSLISSFFDVFTEVSVDGGQTWSSGADGANPPESSVLELIGADLEPAVAPVIHRTGLFPSPCDALSCPPGAKVSFSDAATGQSTIVSNVVMKLFTSGSYLDLDTVTQATSSDYDCVVQLDLSTDGGNTFESVSGDGHWHLSQLPAGSHAGLRVFQTAITQLNISGLPGGLQLQADASQVSYGYSKRAAIQDNQREDVCAFDIVPQISSDGGQTWTTGDQPMQLQLVQQAIDASVSGNEFPPASSAFIDSRVKPPPHAPTISAGGPYHIFLSGFSGSQPLPSGNETNVMNLTAHLSGEIFDGTNWNSFSNVAVSVDCGVWRLDSADIATGDTNVAFYDSEITALNLQGATLPGGAMLRESPSKRSLGRVYFENGDTPTQDRMAGFFDIFTELSFDGGQTWSADTSPVTSGLVPDGPAPVPDGPICPTNIIVYASSTNGTAVYYSVPEFFGDCPFGHHLDVSPPSGSTFAIGTTTVNVTAWDDCGLTNTCSFTVTVLDPNLYPTVAWQFPSDLFPASGAAFLSVNSNHFSSSDGTAVVVRNVQLREFSPPIDPPVLSLEPQSDTFTCGLEYEMSADGGQTFQSFSNGCVLTLNFKNVDGHGLMHIDFTDAVIVGQRHLGFVATSRGEMRISSDSGGYAISSFFDVFTEVTLDNGQTWIPQSDPLPLHLELRKMSSSTIDLLTSGTPEPGSLFPPYTDLYYASGGTNSSSTNHSGSGAGKVSISAFTISRFIGGGTIPPGGTNLSVTADVNMLASLDGQTWNPIHQHSQLQLQASPVSSNIDGTITFDTEMLNLDLSSDGALGVVLIRESPTRRSLGQFDATPAADGSSRIQSFFDIFTEVSTDGGQTWTPMDEPFHLVLGDVAPEQPSASPNLPPQNAAYGGPLSPSFTPSPSNYRFGNGVVLSNIAFQHFDRSYTPPQPGDPPQTIDLQFQATGSLSLDGGNTVTPFHAGANARMAITVTEKLRGQTSYSSDVITLNISGGNLPPGLTFRESPTKASLGRMSVRNRTTSDGGQIFEISSYLDLFADVSLDGGTTWSSSGDSITLVLQPATCPNITFGQPTLASAIVGQTYSQTLSAAGGISPFVYSVTGNLPPGLTLDSTGSISGTPTVVGAYEFQLIATDQAGCSGGQDFTINVNTTCTDTTPPTLSVTSPKNNAVGTTPTITATGTATDNVEGSQVLYSVNGRQWYPISINPPRWTRCTWSTTINLEPGNNVISFISVDKCGANSPVVTRKVFYGSQATMPLTVNGQGSITGPAKLAVGANQLNVGQAYTFNAVPSPNNLFSNIVLYQDDVPTIISASKNVSFTMGANTSITVNFVPNRFIANAGLYTGLYLPSSGVDYGNSGPITMHLTKTGAFSGSITSKGQKSSFTGAFGLDGSLAKSAFTGPIDTLPPTLTLNFAESGRGQITGSITNPVANWVASILLNQAAFSLANPCPLGGSNYTFILPGSLADSTVEPGGDSYGTLKIKSTGTAIFGGKYADGSALAASIPVSADLTIPFCQLLYINATTTPITSSGSAIGWLDVSDPTNAHDVAGITWSHGPVAGIPYSTGFTTTVSVVSSPFIAPASGGQVIEVDNPEILLQGGGLSSAIDNTNGTYGGSPAKVTIPPAGNPNKIKVALAPSGLMSGTFAPDPANPTALLKFSGAVLQNSSNAFGFFLNPNQPAPSGEIIFRTNKAELKSGVVHRFEN